MIQVCDTVYVISKLKGLWKVNKTLYDMFEVHDDYCIVCPKPTLYRRKFEVQNRKLIKDIFTSKEDAEKECNLRNQVSVKYILTTFAQQGVDDLEIKKDNDLITIGYFHECPVDCLRIKENFIDYIVFDRQDKLAWLFNIFDKKIKIVDDYFNK